MIRQVRAWDSQDRDGNRIWNGVKFIGEEGEKIADHEENKVESVQADIVHYR